MFLELDRVIMTLLVEPIKHDLNLSGVQISYLPGYTVVVFNAIIAIPAAWIMWLGVKPCGAAITEIKKKERK